MNRLTDDQLFNVVSTHCHNQIESMSMEELKDQLLEYRRAEYLAVDGKFDQLAVLESLVNEFHNDTDRVREFITANAVDVSEETAAEIIEEFMQ